jgi:hypothetical protein
LDACLLGSLESNSFKPNYWPPKWPLLITVQCPKETDINSSEKTVPLASTSSPGLASLTTPSDKIVLIPEFGIIEFTTQTETPNSTEILIQQSSTSTVLDTSTSTDVIDFDKIFNDNSTPDPENTTQNQEIKTLQTTETPVPLASTSLPDLASLTTPSDEIDLIPEFGIIEFTTETETPNSTETLIQQSSTISTVSKTISITTTQNEEIQTTENIVTTNTPVESPELLLVTPSSTVLETSTSTDVIDFDNNLNDNSTPDPETTTQNQEIKTLQTTENIVTTNSPVETTEKTVP